VQGAGCRVQGAGCRVQGKAPAPARSQSPTRPSPSAPSLPLPRQVREHRWRLRSPCCRACWDLGRAPSQASSQRAPSQAAFPGRRSLQRCSRTWFRPAQEPPLVNRVRGGVRAGVRTLVFVLATCGSTDGCVSIRAVTGIGAVWIVAEAGLHTREPRLVSAAKPLSVFTHLVLSCTGAPVGKCCC